MLCNVCIHHRGLQHMDKSAVGVRACVCVCLCVHECIQSHKPAGGEAEGRCESKRERERERESLGENEPAGKTKGERRSRLPTVLYMVMPDIKRKPCMITGL